MKQKEIKLVLRVTTATGLRWLTKKNPHSPTQRRPHYRFERCHGAKTVGEVLKRGGTISALRYDITQGWVALVRQPSVVKNPVATARALFKRMSKANASRSQMQAAAETAGINYATARTQLSHFLNKKVKA